MNKMTNLVSTILMMGCLTACSEEKTQTVEWYVKHPEILKKEVEKCKLKTLEELAKDKHCVVIEKARAEAFHLQQRDAPLPNIEFKHHER